MAKRRIQIEGVPQQYMQEGGKLSNVTPQSREDYVMDKYASLLKRQQPWSKEDEQALDDRNDRIRSLEGIHYSNPGSYPINLRTLSPQYPREYNIQTKPQFEDIRGPQIQEEVYQYGGDIKAFARNAAKWSKKEYGGPIEHPLAKFLGGGKVDVNGNPIGAWGSNPSVNTPQLQQEVATGYDISKSDAALANDPIAQQQMKPQSGLAPVSPQYATNAPEVDVAVDNGQYTGEEPKKKKGKGLATAAMIGQGTANAIGALGTLGNYFGYKRGLREGANWASAQGSSDNIAKVAGSKGQYTQQGYMPTGPVTQPGFFPAAQGGMQASAMNPFGSQGTNTSYTPTGYTAGVQPGRMVEFGGPSFPRVQELNQIGWDVQYLRKNGGHVNTPQYEQGGIYDMSDDEIKRLSDMGWQLEVLR